MAEVLHFGALDRTRSKARVLTLIQFKKRSFLEALSYPVENSSTIL